MKSSARIRCSIRHWLRRLRAESRPHEPANISVVHKHRREGATIGENTRIYGRLDGVNPHLITIGKHCVVGTNSALLTHCPIRGAQPVVVEDYVWIGFGALILPGVSIGPVSVVGAGAVVTKPMSARSVVAGNPARRLRSLTDREAEDLMETLASGKRVGSDEASG